MIGEQQVHSSTTWLIRGRVFDPARRTLEHKGERLTLSPPVSRLLELLLAHAGRPLEREWLLEQAWNGADVSDDSLSKAVSTLRRLLDDRTQRAIRTVHGVGYQFHPAQARREEATPPGASAITTWSPGLRLAVPAAVTALIMAAVLLSILQPRGGKSASDLRIEHADVAMSGPTNLTFEPGREAFPQLSPDGERFAYIRFGTKTELVIGTVDDPARVQSIVEGAHTARWSPDGKRLAVVIADAGNSYRIEVMNADGSDAEVVANSYVMSNVEWTPDEAAIVFADLHGDYSTNLFLQRLQGPQLREPLFPLMEPMVRVDPRISPDGQLLAYREGAFPESRLVIRKWSGDRAEVYRGDLDQSVRSHDWAPDSNALYLAMHHRGRSGIWNLELNAASPAPQLVLETPALSMLSVSRGNGAVAYSTVQANADIALLSSVSTGYQQHDRIASSEFDAHPSLSPSGVRVAFLSDRTGSPAVWLRASQDAAPRRLPLPGAALELTPAWSADEEHLLAAISLAHIPVLAKMHIESGEVEVLELPAGAAVKAMALVGAASVPVVAVDYSDRAARVIARDGFRWRVLSMLDAVQLVPDADTPRVLAAEASAHGLWAINLDGSGQRRIDVPIYPLQSRRWTLIDDGLLIGRTGTSGTWLEHWRWDGEGVVLFDEHPLPDADGLSRFTASRNGQVLAFDVRAHTEENVQLLKPMSSTLLADR